MSEEREKQRQQAWMNIVKFFAEVEKQKPQLAEQLLPLFTGLIGNKTFTIEKLQEIEKSLNVRFAILGEWLEKRRYVSFSINLTPEEEQMKKVAYYLGLTFPTREGLFTDYKIPRALWPEIDQEINLLSTAIKQALDFGFTPKRIIAGLFYYSTSPEPNAYTSQTLRALISQGMRGELLPINQFLHNWIYGPEKSA